MHLEERPNSVNQILISLRYWDKKNLILFLNQFIQDNCDKISLWLTENQIIDNLEAQDEKTLKSQIISLLQNVKKEDNIVLPETFN